MIDVSLSFVFLRLSFTTYDDVYRINEGGYFDVLAYLLYGRPRVESMYIFMQNMHVNLNGVISTASSRQYAT